MNEDCIFCKIVDGEIPATKVYEDEKFFAFLDIRPVNKGHVLVIPKQHCVSLVDMPDELLTGYLPVLKKLTNATIKAVNADGANVSINNGMAAGQEVFHAHFHIIPRFSEDGLKVWPRNEEEFNDEEVKASIIANLE